MDGDVLAVIPARGGSKGLPGKNILPLAGKPLIAHTIEAARGSARVKKVMVSTDDPEIARVSAACGAQVIRRPAELATDTASSVDVLLHLLRTLEEPEPETLLLLQATSPLRNSSDIDAALDIFDRGGCDAVVSVCEPRHSPYWSFVLNNGLMVPLFDHSLLEKRRQDLPRVYRPNGAIYIVKSNILRKRKDLLFGRVVPYLMPPERSVDIDTSLDLDMAELLIIRERKP